MGGRFLFTSKVKSSSHMTTSLFIFFLYFFLTLHNGGGNGNNGLSSVEATTTTGAPACTVLQFQDLVGLMNMNPTRICFCIQKVVLQLVTYCILLTTFHRHPTRVLTKIGITFNHCRWFPLRSSMMKSKENVTLWILLG